MSTTMIRIDGKTYKQGDISHLSAFVILKAAEELPTLGFTITWDDLVALLKRTSITMDQDAYTVAEQVWVNVLVVWITLNAAGIECTLFDAMGKTDALEVIEGPQDHQGKAQAPKTRQGSARGAASHAAKAPKTPSSSKS